MRSCERSIPRQELADLWFIARLWPGRQSGFEFGPGGVGGGNEYYVFTPEPRHTLPLLGFGLAMMGGVVLSRRRRAGTSA